MLLISLWLGLLSSLVVAGTPMTFDETIVWQCEAAGELRSYQVDELDVMASTFSVQIYRGSGYEALIEIVTVSREEEDSSERLWLGQTGEGQDLKVTALADNLAFEVEDSRYGKAIGRCIRHTLFN
ncbi:MAG: hypothetical protein ACTS2F_17150 [Thainema sp.]